MNRIYTIAVFIIFLLQLTGTSVVGQEYAERSILAEGNLYKVGVAEEGIYAIDYETLEELGINPTAVNPKYINLYGQGGGTLPEWNSATRVDDLYEIPIIITGDEDGSFDRSDRIIFYGQGPDEIQFHSEDLFISREKNIYTDLNFYFLKISVKEGKRVQEREDISAGEYRTSTYHHLSHFEEDKHNLLHFANNVNLQGSGRLWFGQYYNGTQSVDLSEELTISDRVSGSRVHYRMGFASRSSNSEDVRLELNGEEISDRIGATNLRNIEAAYARRSVVSGSMELAGQELDIVLYTPPADGWLDFVAITGVRHMIYRDQPLFIQDLNSFGKGDFELLLKNETTEEPLIWDITDPLEPKNVRAEIDGDHLSFAGRGAGDTIARFIVFAPEREMSRVVPVGKVENQDLHGLPELEYLIIYHNDFREGAEKILQHRQSLNGFSAAMVEVGDIYNEFSSGRQSPTAIRDFVRMIYQRSPSFRYLLLLGDGSFDYRHRYESLSSESFVPVYETPQSLDPVGSFPSDDYYALLSPSEGGNLRGALDISVGRLPVRTAGEALLVAEKIIHYETSPQTLGDWRMNVTFVADDEDRNRHFRTADEIAEDLEDREPWLNIHKVYIDAYEQTNTPEGVYNPAATDAINQNLISGRLLINYIGHGGSKGWAQERILREKDIHLWQNYNRLPLFITATCSFAGYDNPANISAGEQTLVQQDGGAIALFTTVRAVYANSNERLTRNVFNNVFATEDNLPLPIGDVLRISKNSSSADTLGTNARKFTLLGDPAMRLAIPIYEVATTRINGMDVSEAVLDTFKALSKVTIEGEIRDRQGRLANNYNGDLRPTIFDKETQLQTKGQDEGSFAAEFEVRQNVIFSGTASVQDGRFSFTFFVPKDINYVYGRGKISYYSEDGSMTDAAGYFDEVVVGGTDKEGIRDNTGPDVEVYLNDYEFRSGDITGPDPVLLLNLDDDHGINITGNSIGHDLTAVIDGDQSRVLVLNKHYKSTKDDPTKGTVTYPLNDLEEGPHTIRIKAWDIANNSTEVVTDFIVSTDGVSALSELLNYPNPFTDITRFRFKHQYLNREIKIAVRIYTISGLLVKTIETSTRTSDNIVNGIEWDGRTDTGAPLPTGTYIYRVTVQTMGNSQENATDIQKLVIIR